MPGTARNTPCPVRVHRASDPPPGVERPAGIAPSLETSMNNVIYIVGLVVVVIAVLSFAGIV